MIEISTNRRWEKAKHEANKDAKYGIYRYSTAFAFPVKQNGKITGIRAYDVELVILNASDGKKYLYDIVNIKENTADETDLMKRDQRRQAASTRRGASENSIRNSDANVKKYSREVKSAEEYFGITYKVKEAGYITTDGKMLDFSGRHEGAPGGYRTVDHRDITDALGEDYGGEDYSGGMIKFMSEGNIRVSPESGGINLSVAPNKAQRSTLDRYISSFRGEVMLDIDRTNGDTIASVEYPKYTHSSVVFKDIDDYFDKGKIPEKFSREPQIRKNAKVSKQAWAQIQNRRMLKYGNKFDTMPSMDYIFANDNLFVINNYDETSFSVTRKIDPAKDKVLADKIVEAFKNGSITNTREYNSIAKMLRDNARRGNGDNVHARNGRTAGDNARLDDKSERAADRGSATYKGRGDNGVSYSREPESINELRRQNTQLKKRVDYWKGQTQRTKVKTVRQSDVNRLAREVIDMSESDLKPQDITERLSKLGEHILNEKELRYTDIAEMAQDIAEDVVSNATMVVNEDDVQTHNRLKDYLKRVKLKDDGSAEFESIRNSYKRRIMFNKNGLSVDSAYAELNSMFGEGYFPEGIINPADQLERIAEVLDGTAPRYRKKT